MAERVCKDDRRRWMWCVPLVVMVILLALLAPTTAFGRASWSHDGASCGVGCHLTNPPPGPGTNAECQACHSGFQRRAGAPQDCWTCHQPGASMTALQQQAGCVGVCHFYDAGAGTYTSDATPHGTAPHYASTLKTCTTCHGVAVSATNPDGSPHHDAVDFTAPTSASCLTCHDAASPVDGAPAYHGDLHTGVTPTDCAHCHAGMTPDHPTAAALVNPTVSATWMMSGTDVVVSGTLKAGATALPDFVGWVQWKGPLDTEWDAARSMAVTTTATGTFTATVTAPATGTVYRVIFEGAQAGGTAYAPSLGTATQATVKTTITIKLTGLKGGVLKLGRRVTVKGVVTPVRTGKVTITFQRKAGGKWVKVKAVGRTINATSGAYSYTYKPGKRGSWRVNAKVPKTAEATAAKTAWKTFRVK